MKYARMKVQILRTNPNSTSNNSPTTTNNKPQDEVNSQLVDPSIVAKVRKFLESLLNEIKSTWIRHLAFQCMVICPCGKICDLHKTPYCSNNTCLHFLNLDHCLSNPVCKLQNSISQSNLLFFCRLLNVHFVVCQRINIEIGFLN